MTIYEIEREAWKKRQKARERAAFRIKLRKKFFNTPQPSLSLVFGTEELEEVDWMKEGF